MCCHRLYIYSVCGHSVLSQKPLLECRHASIQPHALYSTGCELIAHPYQSWKIERLCPTCQRRRDVMLNEIESSQVVKFDEWRWKVSYGMPSVGKDYWGKKAEERERKEEEESLKVPATPKKKDRFSMKRKSARSSMKS